MSSPSNYSQQNMQTVPKSYKLTQSSSIEHQNSNVMCSSTALVPSASSRDDISIRSYSENSNRMKQRAFTTEDLPSSNNNSGAFNLPPLSVLPPLLKKQTSNSLAMGKKFSSALLKSLKKSFSKRDTMQKELQAHWNVLETDEQQLLDIQNALKAVKKAFKFTTSATSQNKKANQVLKRCENMMEHIAVLSERCHMMFSHCVNEITTLKDYLGKLKLCIVPPVKPLEKLEEKRNLRRVEWAVSRMTQSLQSMILDMKENLAEMDAIVKECSDLLVQVITLLHMRGRTADFSGTGVAVGAAGVVAGTVFGVAGIVAAPVTGGLSIPISIAGKSLLVTGLATLTPSSVMLTRHNKQLTGLAKLVKCLRGRLEIMNQKREVYITAYYSCIEADFNVQQAGYFCQDASDLSDTPFESCGSFIDTVGLKLGVLELNSTLFTTTPSIFHYCQDEDEDNDLLIPESNEDD